MKRQHSYTLAELSGLLNLELRGDGETRVSGLASLRNAGPRDLSFLSNPKYLSQLAECAAAAVIVHPAQASSAPCHCLISEQPYVSYARASHLFERSEAESATPAIHPAAVIGDGAELADDVRVGPNAVIEDGVRLGPGVSVGANCYIGHDSSVGSGTRLHAGVIVYSGVHIDSDVILHGGVVVGADGFGYAFDGERSIKIAQLGGVRIGAEVEVGAGSTIDRGALDDTIIEEGVKIDNHVQIAHNCRIGAHSILCGCVGIAGSARLGRYCTVGGGVGINGHIHVADHVVITAMSFVSQSIDQAGIYSSGALLQENRDWKRNALRLQGLDGLNRRVKELERKVGKEE